MRCLLTWTLVASMLLAFPLTTVADDPPARPLPLTPSQYDGLTELQAQPEHVATLDIHATYKTEREKSLEATRLSDDIFTVLYTAGFPFLVLALVVVGV